MDEHIFKNTAEVGSGAIITFCPPRRFQVIGMNTVRMSPSSVQLFPLSHVRDFTLSTGFEY
jgi:hypothetical protein